MLDYSILDMRSFFTPEEAVKAWCEITELTKENQHDCRHIYQEILEAIRTGQLRAEIPVIHHDSWVTRESWVTRHPESAKIARDDLKAWAESRGVKPKFLFPEMRSDEAAMPVKEKRKLPALEQEENELHALIEKVYLALLSESRRAPNADKILHALKHHGQELDKAEIIREIKDRGIVWKRTGSIEESRMGRKALQNFVSKLNNKYGKQPVVKKIPA